MFLYRKFFRKLAYAPVNRPLTWAEHEKHLPQKKPSPIPLAWPQMDLVRMNSTFVEFVDRSFSRKGFATFGFLALFGMFLYFAIYFLYMIISDWNEVGEADVISTILSGGFIVFLFLLIPIFSAPFLFMEAFNYTHYPMIFNRKTRIVHVFLQLRKGEILSVPWDNLFFNGTHPEDKGDYMINAHKMAEDGETVLETFALSTHSLHDSEYRFLEWEFIRQYMEGDDRKVAELANLVVDTACVNGRRERFFEGLWQAWGAFGGARLYIAIPCLPLILMAAIGRQIVMWTSKFPHWPKEIMDTCQFSPNDPNIRDDKHRMPRTKVPRPDVREYVGR
jgi:hypothetical protein